MSRRRVALSRVGEGGREAQGGIRGGFIGSEREITQSHRGDKWMETAQCAEPPMPRPSRMFNLLRLVWLSLLRSLAPTPLRPLCSQKSARSAASNIPITFCYHGFMAPRKAEPTTSVALCELRDGGWEAPKWLDQSGEPRSEFRRCVIAFFRISSSSSVWDKRP